MGVRSLTIGFVVLYASVAVLASLDFLRRKAAKGGGGGDETIVLAGSTSVQPFAEMVAEEYEKQNRGLEVVVQGGGSTAGIQAVRSGVAAIGMSSRNLKGDERTLTAVIVARDAIAIIVYPSNPVDSLTLEQVRGIFSGAITDWSQVGGDAGGIVCVSREEGSGTRGAFQELALGKTKVHARSLVQDSNGAVKETVASNRRMIGYVSMQFLRGDGRVKGVAVDGIEPTCENAESGKYRLVRSFLLLTDGPPTPAGKKFLEFFLGPAGPEILGKEGLLCPK